ncbi:enoyl-CoA hydratase/isomerase family protein [Plantactinospora sp. KLBMP9567]|uniref:enoyl-CoA hydratase/isomerase family protein n=1 Tax=Plantactinospora sp. KLBMP9567 TaxID=3085900 RepID=UPI002980E202|nr:enoyl-CoA hydratase/isomerase family protein [Plantactinospora sp. KLBMP9567]MDW5329933.1 enoyl-CoA hydratase/isomerase family protein [Plantactinospora sp. KLBMP9567]
MSTTPAAPSLIASDVVHVSQPDDGYLLVVIDNPPLNLFDPTVFAGLHLLREYIEAKGDEIRVVVFESGNPDFFFAHMDFATINQVPDIPGAQNIIEHWPAFSIWLTAAPVVSIAKVRGRARGIGNEFVAACDMRFASLERALLGQIEVGFGVVPGGGGLEWLPRHVGRSRALEIALSADDFDARTAETYGLVNRALPDAELDGYVDALARRIASFNPAALSTAKRLIDKRLPPPSEAELRESFDAILRLTSTDTVKALQQRLRVKAGGSFAPAELDLPTLYGTR